MQVAPEEEWSSVGNKNYFKKLERPIMKSKDLLILLGNQLFPLDEIKKLNTNQIFMAEDYDLCTYEKHHKLKILMFLCAMREKKDELIKNHFNVFYSEITSEDFSIPYEEKLKKYIIKKGSIAINCVSLTIVSVSKNYFQLVIIPHSLKLTNLINLKKNDKVNVEFDIILKYLNR